MGTAVVGTVIVTMAVRVILSQVHVSVVMDTWGPPVLRCALRIAMGPTVHSHVTARMEAFVGGSMGGASVTLVTWGGNVKQVNFMYIIISTS